MLKPLKLDHDELSFNAVAVNLTYADVELLYKLLEEKGYIPGESQTHRSYGRIARVVIAARELFVARADMSRTLSNLNSVNNSS